VESCDFAVNHLKSKKDIPPLSTFYSHIKILWFQLVILVSHNKQKGYFPSAASSFPLEMSAQHKKVDKPAKKYKEELVCLIIYTARHLSSVSGVNGLRLVDILRNSLFIAVDKSPYSQKRHFYPRFYTRFIHMYLCFDFNRLAVL
jgi:hypothetical protein